MAKKKQKPQTYKFEKREKEDQTPLGALGDRIDLSALEKLKQTSQELKQKEQAKLEAEREKKKAEQRTREKNKTFADLLEESNMDWKKFK